MTNLVMWALAGGIAGWIGYSYMNLNEKRGVTVSIVIGMLGGFLGGELLAPMFGAGSVVNPADFNPFTLFIALASAAAILIVSSMIHKRFGFSTSVIEQDAGSMRAAPQVEVLSIARFQEEKLRRASRFVVRGRRRRTRSRRSFGRSSRIRHTPNPACSRESWPHSLPAGRIQARGDRYSRRGLSSGLRVP